MVRRRAGVILVLAAVGLGLSLGYSTLQTPIYTAKAQVLVNPPPGAAAQNLSNSISMETEAQVVKAEPIATLASKALGSAAPTIPTELLKHVSVETSPNSFVMSISYRDTSRTRAQQGANAFANAYLAYKRQQGQAQIEQLQESIEGQLASLQDQQRAANKTLEASTPGTIAYRNAQDALSALSVRQAVLASSLAQLPTVVDPGQLLLPASLPKSPSSPKIPLNAAIGLFLGLAFGVVAAFVLDRMDNRVRVPADLSYYLDAPLLATIPSVKRRGRDRERTGQLVVHLEPRSPVAEAYRTIRTSVLSMAHRRNLQVFAFASPLSGEGKSMTCANVAAALGQADRRVLVVSADIRKPKVHEFFLASNEPGLSEVLEGEFSFSDAVVKADVENVWVLAGGHFPARPAELLQSPSLAKLISEVRGQFDFVVVDCPPVLGLADCLAVLPLVDAVFLVVQADSTRGAAITETADRLERVGVSIDATILNDVKVRRGLPGHHAYGYYLPAEEYLRRQPEPHARRPREPSPMTSLGTTDTRERERGGPERRSSDQEWGSGSEVGHQGSNGEAAVGATPGAVPERSTAAEDA